jgi:hypothetical protein
MHNEVLILQRQPREMSTFRRITVHQAIVRRLELSLLFLGILGSFFETRFVLEGGLAKFVTAGEEKAEQEEGKDEEQGGEGDAGDGACREAVSQTNKCQPSGGSLEVERSNSPLPIPSAATIAAERKGSEVGNGRGDDKDGGRDWENYGCGLELTLYDARKR